MSLLTKLVAALEAKPASASTEQSEAPAPAPAASRPRGRPKNPTPAAQPAPAKDTAPATKEITQLDVRNELTRVVEAKGSVAARDLLAKYAEKIGDLKPADFGKVIADVKAILGENEPQQQADDDDFLS